MVSTEYLLCCSIHNPFIPAKTLRMAVRTTLRRLSARLSKSELPHSFTPAEFPIVACHTRAPQILVEALTGDFGGDMAMVSVVAKSGLDVYAHNIETAEELTPFVRDRRASFRQSLKVLEHAKKEGVRVTKTSIMLGVGENEEQIMDALRGTFSCLCLREKLAYTSDLELRKVDVDVVTFGQYMRPTKRHMKVDRYVEPAEFDRWKQVAEDMGFLYVASGPLVRSSYKVCYLIKFLAEPPLMLRLQAGEYFIENVLKGKGAASRTKSILAEESRSALVEPVSTSSS